MTSCTGRSSEAKRSTTRWDGAGIHRRHEAKNLCEVGSLRLRSLSTQLPDARVLAGGDLDVRRVATDSRKVEPGDLFVAIPGARTHGARYAGEALARGAVAVAMEAAGSQAVGALPDASGLLIVPHARQAVGVLASVLRGQPSERLRLVGVTGTDGKTTTCRLIGEVLATAGRRVGWLTTVDVRAGDEVSPNPSGYTTPEAQDIQDVLARFVGDGVEDAILEVSSHALALDRVHGCSFDAAVFTNLSSEHLNFHGSLDAYASAKARLFEMLDAPTAKRWSRMGVVNADDPASVLMATSSPAAIVSYAIDVPADVRATDLRLDMERTHFRLVTPIEDLDVETRLVGRHNVYNWLAAAAVALGWGIDLAAVREAAALVGPPQGRFQRVRRGQPFEVIVDFAHTPAALAATLGTLRALSSGRILLVFGMAGGRDAGNRPTMGKVAAQGADFFVLSTDDPGSEDPADIAAQVAQGARAAGAVEGAQFTIEVDRRAAIRQVIARAQPGDAVLLAGKGHEQRMLFADRADPWSDEAEVVEILRDLGYSRASS